MTDPIRPWAAKYSEALGEGPTRGKLAAQRARLLLAQSSVPRPSGTRGIWWALATAGVAAAISLGAFLQLGTPQRSSAADVPPIRVGELVQTDELSRSVEFEGGSRAILEPDSKGTLSHYTPELVEVTLQDGGVKVDITQKLGRRWVVKAGNFRVHVIGTAFTVNHDESSGAFGVTVSRGKVSLEGPRLKGRVPLGAGESFRWKPDADSAAVGAPSEDHPSEAGVEESTLLDQEGEKLTIPRQAKGASPRASEASWQDLVSSGKHAAALAIVERRGASTVLGQINADDKILLGNAARFNGNWALAQRAYLSARSSSDAGARSLSAYYLARVALDGQGNGGEATRWFRTYLREAPGGELSASARARLMDLLEKSGDHAAARKVAAEYVAMHPNGPHLDRAKRMSQSAPR